MWLFTLFLLLFSVSAETIHFVYDANGNLIHDGETYRHYNSFNQLDTIYNGTDNSTLLATFQWHPLEERVHVKEVYSSGVWKETYYYWSETFVSKENSSGLYNATYVHFNGQLIAQTTFEGDKEFLHTDHLGSVVAVTDENGTIIERTSYDPYGNILSGGTQSQFDYTGKEQQTTGDYDFNARQYTSKHGVFTQPDSIIQAPFDPQTLNRNMFVRGNPYKFVDKTGRDFQLHYTVPPSKNKDTPFGHVAVTAYNDKGATYYSFYDAGTDPTGTLLGRGVQSGDTLISANSLVDLKNSEAYKDTIADRTIITVDYGLNDEDTEKIKEALETLSQAQDRVYCLYEQNCVTTTRDALSAGRVATGNAILPHNFVLQTTGKNLDSTKGVIVEKGTKSISKSSLRDRIRQWRTRHFFPEEYKEIYGEES